MKDGRRAIDNSWPGKRFVQHDAHDRAPGVTARNKTRHMKRWRRRVARQIRENAR